MVLCVRTKITVKLANWCNTYVKINSVNFSILTGSKGYRAMLTSNGYSSDDTAMFDVTIATQK